MDILPALNRPASFSILRPRERNVTDPDNFVVHKAVTNEEDSCSGTCGGMEPSVSILPGSYPNIIIKHVPSLAITHTLGLSCLICPA